jgi:acetyl esterase/lipase
MIRYPKAPGPTGTEGRCPVVLFSHGLGGNRGSYAWLGRSLASHGFVCVHLEHVGSNTESVRKGGLRSLDGALDAAERPADVAFALDRLADLDRDHPALKGRLDLARVAVAGHSYGAYTAVVCAGARVHFPPLLPDPDFADGRLKAAVVLSPQPPGVLGFREDSWAGVRVPVLYATGTRDAAMDVTDPGSRRYAFDHGTGDRWFLDIDGADHFTFAGIGRDAALDRHLDWIRTVVVAFLDATLRGDAAARAWLGSGAMGEVSGGKAVLEARAGPSTGPGQAPPASVPAAKPVTLPYAMEEGVAPDLLSLDVYAPAKAERLPVMVFVHGGGWSGGDKGNAACGAEKARWFNARGWVYASVNYRLSPAVVHPAHAKDVARALAFVHGNAARWGGDPDRVFVMGHSAGAHLAALVATDERLLGAGKEDLSMLKGVVLLDGAGYDIPATMAMPGVDGVVAGLFRAAFGDDPAAWKDASPMAHVAAGKGIPPFLALTAAGRVASTSRSRELVEALRKAGVFAETADFPGKDHGTINREFGDPGDGPTGKAMDFLDGVRALLDAKR